MSSTKLPIKFLLTGLALSLTSITVYANPTPVDVNALWSGVYFGTYFGAGGGDVKNTQTENSSSLFQSRGTTTLLTSASTSISSTHLKGDVTGSIADLFVGFNWHPDCTPFLLGAQAEGSFFSDITYKARGSEATLGTSLSSIVSGGIFTVTGNSVGTGISSDNFYDDLRSMFKIVGRAGYIINPATMFYILGGGVAGHFVVPDSLDFTGGRRNRWVGGYTVGAGVEYMFNEHWSLRGEYRFLDFDYNRNITSFSTSTSMSATSVSTNTSYFASKNHINFEDNLGEIGIVYRI